MMKKRILCMFLVVCLVFSMIALVSCNDDESADGAENSPAANAGDKQGQVHTTTDTSANVDPSIDRPVPDGATQPQ